MALAWGAQLFMEKQLGGATTLAALHSQAEVAESLLPTAWDQAAILKTLVAEGESCWQPQPRRLNAPLLREEKRFGFAFLRRRALQRHGNA